MKSNIITILKTILQVVKKFKTWLYALFIEIIPATPIYISTTQSQNKPMDILSHWPIFLATLIFAILLMTIWELSKSTENNFFDYRIKRYVRKVHFKVSNDKESLDAYCEREYQIECLNGSIGAFAINAGHMEALMPFTGSENFEIEVLPTDNKGVTIDYQKPYRTEGDVLAFRLLFRPEIQEGDIVTAKVKFKLPHFAVFSKEKFDELVAQTKTETYKTHQAEYHGTLISRPTTEMSLIFQFDKDCGIKPQRIIAKYFGVRSEKEMKDVNKKCRPEYLPDGSLCLNVTRKKPPVGMRYEFEWIPCSTIKTNEQKEVSEQ